MQIFNNFPYIGVSHLIGPNSCLCTACFRAIEKRNSIKYLQKHACSIMTCKRSATHSFKLPWLNKIKKCYQNKKEVCKIIIFHF